MALATVHSVLVELWKSPRTINTCTEFFRGMEGGAYEKEHRLSWYTDLEL